jgi:hypothetical protein
MNKNTVEQFILRKKVAKNAPRKTVDIVREDVLVSSLFLLGKTRDRNKRY